MENKKILDIGCGAKKASGSIGMDILALEGVDIIHDLDQYPYPIKDSEFDEIRAINAIEHISNVMALMKEIHRILKPGGIFHFEVPHYSSCDMFTDPTHKTFFSYRSMDYFVSTTVLNQFKYDPTINFEIVSRKIVFWGSKRIIDGCLEFIFNKMPYFYERKLAWIFPAHQLVFDIKCIK